MILQLMTFIKFRWTYKVQATSPFRVKISSMYWITDISYSPLKSVLEKMQKQLKITT